MKLKGVAMHHDQGALGARAYRAAIARQIDIVKEMGANAIRVTHNPASRDLIDLADEKGMLIIEEFFDGFQHPKTATTTITPASLNSRFVSMPRTIRVLRTSHKIARGRASTSKPPCGATSTPRQ